MSAVVQTYTDQQQLQQQQHSSSSSLPTSDSDSMFSMSLAIQPRSLENRFWTLRCLHSLDTLYEMCNTLIWLSILPMLQGSDRTFGKASLVLAGAQLAAIHLTPALWARHRSSILSAAMLLRCGLLLLQARPGASMFLTAAVGPTPSQPLGGMMDSHMSGSSRLAMDADAAGMTVAASFWSNLLFVLFHQQPVRIQAPLLAVSSLLQAFSTSSYGWGGVSSSGGAGSAAWLGAAADSISNASTSPAAAAAAAAGSSGGSFGVLPSVLGHSAGSVAAAGAGGGSAGPATATELMGVSQALSWGFGLLAAGGVNPSSVLWQLAVPPQETSMLATMLFVHGFGGFLLPVFVAYVIEWRYKVTFLLSACNLPQQQQLQVLTPAAAIVRASLVLGCLLYLGWLLLLATSSWLLCCAVASLLVVT